MLLRGIDIKRLVTKGNNAGVSVGITHKVRLVAADGRSLASAGQRSLSC
jgi:hypothetical protein